MGTRSTFATELQYFVSLDFDLDAVGFEPAEVDQIIEEVGDADEQPEDAVPPFAQQPAVSEPGDLWLLGNHVLACGVDIASRSYALLMRGEKAQFVFTDPPYNVPIDGHVCGLGRIPPQELCDGLWRDER